MASRALARWGAALVFGLALACGGTTPEITVSDDVTRLRRHIQVPEGLEAVRWAARPRGVVGMGPTDLELLAFFPLDEDEWDAVASTLGPAVAPRTLYASDALMRALGFAGAIDGLGVTCAPFEAGPWRCVDGVRREDGVFVVLVTQ